jgi:ubiquinone/menaquinone biosynthesis C-methylase UbiE
LRPERAQTITTITTFSIITSFPPLSLRKIFYTLPVSWRYTARKLYYAPIDLIEGATGKRDALTPPKGMIFTGSGDFRQQGRDLVKTFEKLGGLQPNHRVLDIGSGIGRIAVGLTEYLNKEGSYEGFDVMERGVVWCQKNITSRFPNFKFLYTPLKNDLYRDDGESADNFRFPYDDNSFDSIILTSVFTHMMDTEVKHYMGEIQRVLKPTGKCFATYFLLDDVSKKGMKTKESFNFPYDYGHYRLMDDKVKSANIAFEMEYLEKDLVAENNLTLEAVHLGWWSGRDRDKCESFQDIVILGKRS